MNIIWHEKLKAAAEQKFLSTPLPNTKSENFRFTSLDEVSALLQQEAKGSSDVVPASLLQKGDDEAGFLVFSDSSISGEKIKNKEVYFSDLRAALGEKEELLKTVFSEQDTFADDKFALLAKARWQNGGFLHVSKNVQQNKPLRISHWVSKGLYAFRTVIVLDAGAEATLVEEFCGDDQHQGVVAGLVEVHLAPGARLKYVQVENLGKTSDFFIRQKVICAENSHAEVVPVYVGGKKGQLRHDAHLNGKGAHVALKGAARGRNEQHFDFWLNALHATECTSSHLDFWFVMADKARAVFNGLLDIKKTGLQTDAYQKSRSLLLSDKATVHTIPKLLIATDQVQCSHGASVSTLNPDQVYYLQSRGMQRTDAERMIVRGFTQPVLDLIPIDAVFERAELEFSKIEEVLQ